MRRSSVSKPRYGTTSRSMDIDWEPIVRGFPAKKRFQETSLRSEPNLPFLLLDGFSLPWMIMNIITVCSFD